MKTVTLKKVNSTRICKIQAMEINGQRIRVREKVVCEFFRNDKRDRK